MAKSTINSIAFKRKWINLRNQINYPLTINPFVKSRSFITWIILGIIGGIVTSLYWLLISNLMEYTHNFLQGWQVITIMTVGGLIIGLIIHFYGDPGELEIVVNNVRFNGGKLDTHNNVPMIITSALGIGIGSNAGPEAPMVQVNGSIGSWLAKKLRLKGDGHRSLSIAGMAIGFSNMFGSPLGGTLFALEIMHHKRVTQYYKALIPAFVASTTGYLIFHLLTQMPVNPVWALPFKFSIGFGVNDILWSLVYGLAGAIVGWLIIWSFRTLEHSFKKAKMPFYIQTTLSGLILGILAWQLPITRYFSHFEFIDLVNQSWTLWALVVIMVVKIFSMTLCVTSGWRGGFIVPIFFIGAALGMILFKIDPASQNAGLAVVCCMAAVNACVTRTLLSSVLLVAALCGYAFIAPILFAGLTGFFLAPRSPMIAASLDEEKTLREEEEYV